MQGKGIKNMPEGLLWPFRRFFCFPSNQWEFICVFLDHGENEIRKNH